MTDQEKAEVFDAALKDAAGDLIRRMISVAGQSVIAGDADDVIVERARTGLREFVRSAKLIRAAVTDELSAG